jgi:hypothetical protein
VDALTPTQWFFAGVVAAVFGLLLFFFVFKRSVARYRKVAPDALPIPEQETRPKERDAAALDQRLQEIERRLAELERQKRE